MENFTRKTARWFPSESRNNEGQGTVYSNRVKEMVKALRTIDDLGLNKVDLRNYRLNWTRRFTGDWKALPPEERGAFAEFSTRKGVEFAGTTLKVVQQLQKSQEV